MTGNPVARASHPARGLTMNVYRIFQQTGLMKEHPLVACHSNMLPSMIRQNMRSALSQVERY